LIIWKVNDFEFYEPKLYIEAITFKQYYYSYLYT